ncbi:MAG: hypothetical protein ACOY46_11375 [Bacillota bacterium]
MLNSNVKTRQLIARILVFSVICLLAGTLLAFVVPSLADAEPGAQAVSGAEGTSPDSTGPGGGQAAEAGGQTSGTATDGSDSAPTGGAEPGVQSGDPSAGSTEGNTDSGTPAQDPGDSTQPAGEPVPDDQSGLPPEEETGPAPADPDPATEPATEEAPSGDSGESSGGEAPLEPEQTLSDFYAAEYNAVITGTGTFDFPNDTSAGGFVLEFEYLYSYFFNAADTGESKAEVSFFNVSPLNGFRFFKNLHDPAFGNYSWVISASNAYTLGSELKIYTPEMYSHSLTDRTIDETETYIPVEFPPDFWTTEPETDLVALLYNNGRDGSPVPELEGSGIKFNTHRLRASQITLNNFVFSVEPGHQSTEVVMP